MQASRYQLYQQYLRAACQAYQQKDYQQALLLLESAHVLGQSVLWPHLQSHYWMLKAGWRARDWCEIRGQLWRLLLTPLGHLFARLPLGNTGRARVSAFAPMAVSAELQQQLHEAEQQNRPAS